MHTLEDAQHYHNYHKLLHRDSLAANEGPLFPSRFYAHKIGHSNCVILRESGEGLISCSIYNTQFTTYLRQNCAVWQPRSYYAEWFAVR